MKLWKKLRRRLAAPPVHVLEPRVAYDRWARQYAEEKNPVLHLATQTLQKLLPELHGKSVLDAGCGAGHRMQQLAPQIMVGADFSFNMLCAARAASRAVKSLRLVNADLLALPFHDESFDLVISAFVLGYLAPLETAVSELARVTRAGGTLLLADFHPLGHWLGWNRSFLECHNGKLEEFRIVNCRHQHEDYFRAFKKNGLHVEDLCEPPLDDSVKHFFDRTRKGRKVYERFHGFPVVLIFKLTKR